MEICDVCLGVEKAQPAPEPSPPSPMCVCQECGEEFEPYKNGPILVKKVCWQCVKKKKEKPTSKKRGRPKKENPPVEMQTQGYECAIPAHDPLTVTLDFSRYPWALEYLKITCNGNDPALQLVREFAVTVPAEWLKDHLLNDGEVLMAKSGAEQ